MEIERQVLVTGGTRHGKRPARMTQHAREALYASITGVATLLVMIPSSEAFTGRSAASSLLGTMGGLFAAGLVADTIAHASEGGGATRRSTMRRILGASIRALEITVVPAVLLLLSDTGIWSLRTGLTLAIAALTVTQLVPRSLGLARERHHEGAEGGLPAAPAGSRRRGRPAQSRRPLAHPISRAKERACDSEVGTWTDPRPKRARSGLQDRANPESSGSAPADSPRASLYAALERRTRARRDPRGADPPRRRGRRGTGLAAQPRVDRHDPPCARADLRSGVRTVDGVDATTQDPARARRRARTRVPPRGDHRRSRLRGGIRRARTGPSSRSRPRTASSALRPGCRHCRSHRTSVS